MWAQVAREEPNRSSEICCCDLGSRFYDFGSEQLMSWRRYNLQQPLLSCPTAKRPSQQCKHWGRPLPQSWCWWWCLSSWLDWTLIAPPPLHLCIPPRDVKEGSAMDGFWVIVCMLTLVHTLALSIILQDGMGVEKGTWLSNSLIMGSWPNQACTHPRLQFLHM